ncbi:Ca2+-binding RTX toxin-like protein [Acidovorax soli]|uniref:Ca2+-binding RTX toxin-like protein n=1 Tax=Acidovorax soli TaxID=592050 RepID=A0A7X0PHN2_9BURK|nr:calcium-binding protein [Acidovorax soli]MBB6562152.1 Ca2+-binding RTX toxin-like protein [Acidovorax soli]
MTPAPAPQEHHFTQRLDQAPGQSDLIGLMALMFNAPPGGWMAALTQVRSEAGSLTALADLLAGTPQFQGRFAGKTTPTQILDTFLSFIGLVPGTQAHAAAGTAVLAQLQAGASVGTVMVQVLQFLQTTTEPLFQPARQYLTNMVEVATYHTVTLGLKSTSVDDMRTLLAKVTSDPASVTQAKQALDQLVAPPAPSPSAPPPPPPPPALTSADSVGDINTKMGAYAGTGATANASGMTAQQLEALGNHAAKLQANGLTGLTLDLGAAQMTDAISAALLGKASAASVVATNATSAEVDSLVTLVAHITAGGITGTLPVTLAQLADVRGALAPKLAAGLTLAVSGTAAANSIDLTGLANTATAAGGADDDTYIVDSTTHTIVEASGGGTGIDTLQSSVSITLATNVEVLSLTGSGNLSGTGLAGNDTLQGNSGDNLLSGAGGSDAINGDAGNDTLDGGTGADALVGGTGDDRYVVDDAGDTVTEIGGQGVDTIEASVTYTLAANAEVLSLTGSGHINGTGTADNDTLIGNSGNNELSGANGHDSLQGGDGNDTLQGGDGDDTLLGGTGANVFDGGTGTNTIILDAGATSNRVIASLTGSGLQNISNFNPSTDVIDVGQALGFSFEVDSGAFQEDDYDGAGTVFILANGNQELWFDADGANGSAAVQIAHFAGGAAISAANIEPGNNNLTGTSGADSLIGTGANNLIQGLGGDDTLEGGGGNDTLDGGTGIDSLAGGTGDDLFVVDDAGDVVTEFGGEGTDTLQSSITYTLPGNVEVLSLTGSGNFDATGTVGNDTLIGNSGNNWLQGLDGNDLLQGGDGDDQLDQSAATTAGASRLEGGNGSDSLLGGAARDTLEGGAGLDTLAGGGDADEFLLGSLSLAMDTDRITDFGTGGADMLHINNPGFGLSNGTLTPTNYYEPGSGTFTQNAYGGNTNPVFIFIQNPGVDGGKLYFDQDGEGTGSNAFLIGIIQNGGSPATMDHTSIVLV